MQIEKKNTALEMNLFPDGKPGKELAPIGKQVDFNDFIDRPFHGNGYAFERLP